LGKSINTFPELGEKWKAKNNHLETSQPCKKRPTPESEPSINKAEKTLIKKVENRNIKTESNTSLHLGIQHPNGGGGTLLVENPSREKRDFSQSQQSRLPRQEARAKKRKKGDCCQKKPTYSKNSAGPARGRVWKVSRMRGN